MAIEILLSQSCQYPLYLRVVSWKFWVFDKVGLLETRQLRPLRQWAARPGSSLGRGRGEVR